MPDRANVRRHARLLGYVSTFLRAGGETVSERNRVMKPSTAIVEERVQVADLLTDEWAFEVYAGMSVREWSRALAQAKISAIHDERGRYGVVAVRPGWDKVGDLLVITDLRTFASTLSDRSNA